MNRKYRLKGLDCANCASKMETAISKLPGVEAVTIDFMTTKMVLEVADDQMDQVLESAKAIIKKLEPDVEVVRA